MFVGVDFQVKLMFIENRVIALQLWDTVSKNFKILLNKK
jgi:hypothetical protein